MKDAADFTENVAFQRDLNKLRQTEEIISRSSVIFSIFRFAKNRPLSYISANVNQWGYSQEDFLSGRITWQQIMPPEDVCRIEAEVAQHLKSKNRDFTQNYRIIDKTGK